MGDRPEGIGFVGTHQPTGTYMEQEYSDCPLCLGRGDWRAVLTETRDGQPLMCTTSSAYMGIQCKTCKSWFKGIGDLEWAKAHAPEDRRATL